jgi:repressor LexA
MTRREVDGLIEHERKILAAVRKYFLDNGYAPSYRDIGKAIGNQSLSHIRRGLETLDKHGLIHWDRKRSRAIQLVADEFVPVSRDLLRLPIVGMIQAGEPIFIPDGDLPSFDHETYVDLPREKLPRSTADLFALKVRGDSMIDAMIADGDVVVFRKVDQGRNGKMVAAWLPEESETTLKYFYLENGQVRLQPANPMFNPLFFAPGKVEVKGEVVYMCREY